MYVIKSTCSGCHTCELSCPSGAIGYQGIQYEVDQTKCVGCGTCYSVCPTCSVENTEEKKMPPHAAITKSCDIVVCGGGTGIIAAVRAARAGKKVILVEKAKKLGGNTTLAHGFMVPYSKLHQQNGAPDGREQMVEGTYKRAEGWIDKKLIHAALYGVCDFFDWLCQFPGTTEAFQYKKGAGAVGPMAGGGIDYSSRTFESLNNPDPSIGPGWMGTFVVRTLQNAILEQKLPVEVLTGTAAKHLITDESGKVTGVECEDEGGTVLISAKAAILATGGMGSSDEKLEKYFGLDVKRKEVMRFSVAGDTGDGIDMLEELGIKPDRSRLFLSLFGPAHHPWAYTLYRIMAHPSCLAITSNGKRYFDETGNHYMSRMFVNSLPGSYTWGITTDSLIDYMIDYYHKEPQFGDDPSVYDNTRSELEAELAADIGTVFKADTLDELAERMGMDSATLKNAVESYNEMCRAGVDTEFGKEARHLLPLEKGPYYALKAICFSEGAFGGLRVDARCQVLRDDGTVIPGLYGVGDATSAMHRQTVLAPVSELTWAVASSYISGGGAVEYVDER